MKVVIAPDKFKGCLTAAQVAAAIAAGLRGVDPSIEIDECPMADGGEGTVAALVSATGGQLVTRRVTGPLPEMKVEATFGAIDERTAVIEMAAAAGLALLPARDRNPMLTTTFGVGELINSAVELGARRIILGIGGSATVDAGIGCAQATGHTIILEDGAPVALTEPLTGADVRRVVLVKRHRGERTVGVEIIVACDVDNPLYGPNGAAEVFAPQKGATPEQVKQLDDALEQLATRLDKTDLAHVPGAGAAGGMGFGMMAFFGASLRRGVEIVIEAARLRERLSGAALCITGEGRLDDQSFGGKTVSGVARACRDARVPCFAIAGSIADSAADIRKHGILAAMAIQEEGMSLTESMRNAPRLLENAARRLLKTFSPA
jgi:glycerate kinase